MYSHGTPIRWQAEQLGRELSLHTSAIHVFNLSGKNDWAATYHFRFLSRQVKHAATARRRGYLVFGNMRLSPSIGHTRRCKG